MSFVRNAGAAIVLASLAAALPGRPDVNNDWNVIAGQIAILAAQPAAPSRVAGSAARSGGLLIGERATAMLAARADDRAASTGSR